jgi:hypothetical protein
MLVLLLLPLLLLVLVRGLGHHHLDAEGRRFDLEDKVSFRLVHIVPDITEAA